MLNMIPSGRKFRCLGVGSPLVDLLSQVPDSFIDSIPGEKGGMVMVDAAEQNSLIELLQGQVSTVPGGSAGNTVFALARLGIPCAMLGKLGEDEFGRFYRQRLTELGGSEHAFFRTTEAPTGTCLSLITPDGERTMRSNLAASLLLTPEDVETLDFSDFDLVYIEGYMLFNPAFRTILHRAGEAGCMIGFDLASFEVVRAFREELPALLTEHIDIIVANEEEAAELFGGNLSDNEMLEELARWSRIAVIKKGKAGALIRCGAEQYHVPAELVEDPLDTTAAGDLWAAGFLYGLFTGRSLDDAAHFGAVTSGEVVKVIGSEMGHDSWEYIRKRLQ
jgi:sugar/nucleoside kinase (ribokinase family)